MLRYIVQLLLVACLSIQVARPYSLPAKAMDELLIITAYTYEGRYEYRYISSLVQDYQQLGGQCTPVVEILGCQSLNGVEEWMGRFRSIIEKHPNPKFIVLVGAEAWACYFSLTEPKYKKIPVACFMGQRYGAVIEEGYIPSMQAGPGQPKGVVDFLEVMKPFNVKFFHYYDYDIESDYRLIQHMFPGTKDIALISDNTFVGLGEMRIVEHTLKKLHPDVTLHYIDGSHMDLDEALQAVSALPKGTVAILCIWRYDRHNVIYMNNADYLFKTVNPKLPVFSLTGTGMGYWCIGGSTPVYDNTEGEQTAAYIYELVDRKNEVLPREFRCYDNQFQFDMQQLRAYNIDRTLIPKNSLLLNANANWELLFDAYKWYVLLILLVIALLTVGFLVSLRYSLRIRQLTKRLEEEKRCLQRSERELRVAKERAEESDRLKSAFIASMSHEIRTPLNAIVGFSTILEEETKDYANLKEYVYLISHNSDLLLKLINDVLDLARLDSGRQYFNFKMQDLTDLCDRVMAAEQSVMRKDVRLLFNRSTPTIMAETDSTRLQQVLINLVGNAVKFTEKGTVELKVEPDEQGKQWLFSVSDTGCGIPRDKHQKVFERFVKLDEYTQGTGLGLPICQTTVERLGGRIWIDPDYTEGARFVFTIPYKHLSSPDEEV